MDINRNLHRILVPVPLNREFSIPLEQAIHFQKVYHSEIILLNVVPEQNIFHRILKPEKLRKHKRKAKSKLKKLTRKCFNGTIPSNLTIKVVSGELIGSILTTAVNLDCNLIIIKKATRVKGRLSYLRAENADKLIAEAVCPVLTIMNRPTDEKIQDILIPIDVLKKSSEKVAWSVSLARRFNARLHMASVLNMNINLKDSLAYKKSRKIEYSIRKEGIDVTSVILRNSGKSPYQAILDHADEIKPDMLLIMTHQESIFPDNNLGSFAREIIHNSHYPVFSVVPSREPIREGFMKSIPHRESQSVDQGK